MVDMSAAHRQAGSPRTKSQTLQDLHEQEERAFGGAPSSIAEMGTRTGTKDKYFQHFVNELQSKANKLRKDGKPLGSTVPWEEHLAKSLREVRDSMPENIFNPVLQIPGACAFKLKFSYRDIILWIPCPKQTSMHMQTHLWRSCTWCF